MKMLELIDQEEAKQEYEEGVKKMFGLTKTPIKVTKKPGRNDPCHCGSGKKYKNCCMELDKHLEETIDEWND